MSIQTLLKRLTFFLLLFSLKPYPLPAQKITYSDIEKKDPHKFVLQVITKYTDRILVYKGTYSALPFNRTLTATDLTTADPSPVHFIYPIDQSDLDLYDDDMKLLRTIHLPLPQEITGVHFLVYNSFFYLFYQYQHNHTVYCMAVKINMDGKIVDKPIELDRTEVMDYNYQSQVYTVIYSEDKKQVLAFKIDSHTDGYNIVTGLFFNENLQLKRRSIHPVPVTDGIEFLSEFNIDNDGNFLFIRISESVIKEEIFRTVLIVEHAEQDSISFYNILPASVYVDDIRLKIDNLNKKYVLLSCYSSTLRGDIEGIYAIIWNPVNNSSSSITKTKFDNELRKEIQAGGNNSAAFNHYFLQNIYLNKDGSFLAEAEHLYKVPEDRRVNRWNYLQNYSYIVASQYVFYSPYGSHHYYPWMTYIFGSNNTVVLSFNAQGKPKWINTIHMPQANGKVGYITIPVADRLYFVHNITIRQQTFLTAQSISIKGDVNPDERFKEDVIFKGADKEYLFQLDLGKQVGDKELIVPCIVMGNYTCLARIQL